MSDSIQFVDGAAVGFAMYVPEAFRAALRSHSFQAGDTIYDTRAAYDRWDEALKRLQICLAVTNAVPGPGGSLTFTISRPNRDRTAIARDETRTVTQQEFIRLLREGIA